MVKEVLPYLPFIMAREGPTNMTVIMARDASMAAYYKGYVGASLAAYYNG
jgi:hypothetical protein